MLSGEARGRFGRKPVKVGATDVSAFPGKKQRR
jgi:hypothetical protein